MPELPEVETIRRGLMGFILGRKILRVKVREGKSWIGDVAAVEGAEIVGLKRKGKALLIELDNGRTLMIHLRMTGQLIWVGDERFAGGHPSENFVDELPNKQTRVEIELAAQDGKIVQENKNREKSISAKNGKNGDSGGFPKSDKSDRNRESSGVLYFNDQRKFGFIKVLKTDEVESEKFIRELGPEPWEMSEDEWWERLQRHKSMIIKAVLLDQKIIAGLGNIYTDETLYTAAIHPERRAGSLNREQVRHILLSARQVMEKAIKAGGSTLENYVQADGSRGDYLDKFARVYHREGARCERCGGAIEKMRVAGRGTYYCPRCQRLGNSRRVAGLKRTGAEND